MKVFYTPASGQLVPRVIDSVVLIDGEERGACSRETLAELAKRYPTVTVGDLDEVSRIKEEMMRSDPEPCTEEQFWEALECLPPLNWVRAGGGESFKMAERLSGRMTTIYARSGSTYWSFVDCDDLTHAAIMAKVTAAIRGEVVL
jgi:hypothetical protein